jgi:UDP-N-acetylmuramate--alanine ligase
LFRKDINIHFVGIGGIGMSGIAELLLNLGYRVTGSDLQKSEITDRLQGLGVEIKYGHRPENVADDVDVLVYSSAVRRDNPEVVAAEDRMVPVIPRAEMLGELMRMKYSIAVAGSHGKTTTTSMISMILAAADWDPTIVVGGKLKALGSNAKLGRGECLVAEADESDGSFLRLIPTVAVVTNIDPEHLDHFGTLETLKDAFADFLDRLPFFGFAVLCLDHPNVQDLLPGVKRRVITYGYSRQADYVIGDLEKGWLYVAFTPHIKGEQMEKIRLNVPGDHNAANALAAVAVCSELGVPYKKIKEGLESFSGVARRFELKGEKDGAILVDDYGHHPEEIKHTIQAARDVAKDRRLVVIFQPHRYTRTRDLFREFTMAFNDADVLVVMEIYAAGEDPIEGITGEGVYEGIKEHGHREIYLQSSIDDAVNFLDDFSRRGDMILTLGAGDVYRVGEIFLNKGGEDDKSC